MLVKDIIFEREDKTLALANQIISMLKKTPSVDNPISQFKDDPNKVHSSARSRFRSWATRQGLSYVNANVMQRGGAGTTRIAFYSFVGMMQKECGIAVTGILDVSSMKAFVKNANKFSDSYMTSRVEQAIAGSSLKVPRGCIDVVKAIENPDSNWSSTYATYHDRNGKLDFGIGPGQVEPKTYSETGGKFNFGNFNHTTSIDMLTNIMLEAIILKMKYADRLAKKAGKETTTLEDFARAWNYKNFGKAKGVYGDGTPMRPEMVTKAPPARPAELEPKVDKTSIDKAVKKAIEPEPKQEPGYFNKLKKGLGSMMRNYLDSDR